MQFTPDGGNLLTVTDNITRIAWPSKEVRIAWQTDGKQTMTRATFSPDGSRFARSENGDKVHVHETATGRLLHTFQGRDPRFTATAWSPDGGRLAVGVGSEAVIHDVKTGEEVQRIGFGESSVAALAWSHDNKWIAAATEKADRSGGSAFLRQLGNGSAVPIPLPGNRDVKFSFSPDSTILAVVCEVSTGIGSWREILYFWDLAAQKTAYQNQGHGYNHIVHSHDGRWLAACGLNELVIFDARTGGEVHRLHADSINNHIWSMAFSPDSKVLATGIEDRIRFRDTTTWDEIDPDETLRAPVSALAFSSDGRHLMTGGWNGDLILWDWEKKTPVWKKLSPPETWEIKGLSIDPTARWIGAVQHLYQNNPRPCRLVDFATGETIRFVDVPNVTDAPPLFHPTKRTAYLATLDHDLVEWDCEDGQILRKIPVAFLRGTEAGRIRAVDAMSFDPGAPEVIRWTADNQAYGRVHVGSGVESLTFETRFIRPDSDSIPPRSHDFAAIGPFVWNLPSFHQVTPAETNDARSSATHPSELMQFSASGQSVRVFDILSQSFIQSFNFGPGDIKAFALSPDGFTLVAGTTGGLRYVSLEGSPVKAGTSTKVLWRLMGGDNHWQAYQAAWALARQPDWLRFLESHLTSAREPAPEEISRLKQLLADSDHTVRQAAARQWLDLGLEPDRATYDTLGKNGLSEKWPTGFPDISSDDYEQPVPPLLPLSAHRRAMRAVVLLKADRSDAARRQLERLAGGHAGAPLTKAAARALVLLEKKVSPADR